MRQGKLLEFWQSLHIDHRRIAGAAVWLFLLTALAKVAVLLREIAIAAQFARGAEVDAFNLASTLAMWLPTTLYSVVSVVFIPELVRARKAAPQVAQRLCAELNGLGLIAGVALAILTWAVAPSLASWFARALPSSTYDNVIVMLRSFSILAFVAVIAAVFAIRVQARNDHRYALAEGLVPLVVAIAVVLWHERSSISLIAGALIGVGLQAAWLGKIDSGKPGGGLALSVPQWQGDWPRLTRSMVIMGVGSIAMSFAGPLDHYFAAQLGSGEVASYGYATRVLGIGMTFAAMVVSRSMLSVFSESEVAGSDKTALRRALQWAGLMLIAGVLFALVLTLLASDIVALLYERGSFTADDTARVSDALVWGGWQLPFYLSGLVLVSMMASMSRFAAISAIGVIGIAAKLVLNVLLVVRFGLGGLFLASALMYVVTAAACYLFLVNAKTHAN